MALLRWLPLLVVPPRLWLTTAGWLFCALNLALSQEIWPHTPLAQPVLAIGLRLFTLLLLPQLALCGWRWLRAWPMPGWLRLPASAAYLAGAFLLACLWLALFVEAAIAVATGQLT